MTIRPACAWNGDDVWHTEPRGAARAASTATFPRSLARAGFFGTRDGRYNCTHYAVSGLWAAAVGDSILPISRHLTDLLAERLNCLVELVPAYALAVRHDAPGGRGCAGGAVCVLLGAQAGGWGLQPFRQGAFAATPGGAGAFRLCSGVYAWYTASLCRRARVCRAGMAGICLCPGNLGGGACFCMAGVQHYNAGQEWPRLFRRPVPIFIYSGAARPALYDDAGSWLK